MPRVDGLPGANNDGRCRLGRAAMTSVRPFKAPIRQKFKRNGWGGFHSICTASTDVRRIRHGPRLPLILSGFILSPRSTKVIRQAFPLFSESRNRSISLFPLRFRTENRYPLLLETLVLCFSRLLCEGGATAAAADGRPWRWSDRERLGQGV